MAPSRTRLHYLLERYADKQAAGQELQELAGLLEQSWDEQALGQEAPPVDWPVMLQAILAEGRASGRPATPVNRGRFGLRWIAAAAIIGLLVIGVWYGTTHPNRPVLTPAIATTNDVLPGGNKAVLTLSGGRQVVLDSTTQDTVLMEGAAIVAGAKGKLAYNAGSNQSEAMVYNTLTTPRGGQYQLTLPDGTRVWLNAASSITYPTAFTGTDRTVTITGEAYLEVAPKPDQPFTVTIGDQQIAVLGTSFNVNAYPDEPSHNTTLVEGKVKVSNASHSVTLNPGQQAQVTTGRIAVVPHADLSQTLAWKNGFFAFREADLRSVMRQLSRWYDVNVVYEGQIPSWSFNGTIVKDLTLDQLLKGLAKTHVHYEIVNPHQLIIRP